MFNEFSIVAKHHNNNPKIITRSDKGTGDVFLRKDKYWEKMMTILPDKNIFYTIRTYSFS